MAHDSRCLSLTDGPYNEFCDCDFWGWIDAHTRSSETDESGTCTDCGRGGWMLHDSDGDPWCVHHGPFGPDTEPGGCCPHAEPEPDVSEVDHG